MECDDEVERPAPIVFDGEHLLVAHKRCNECLFTNNRVVRPGRREDILAICKKHDSSFVCHKATLKDRAVVCRGFFEETPSTICQIAGRLGWVKFVDPATGEER